MDYAEIKSRYEVRKLSADEQLKSFNCGDADLNDFLLNEATLYRKALLAVTYVFEEKNTKRVAAFFSLANDRVSLSDFENKTEFNRFRKNRFPNEKRLIFRHPFIAFYQELFCRRQQNRLPFPDG